MDNKVKLADVASTLVVDALNDFVSKGGTLRDGPETLTPELVAAANGGLPAILFWADEYYAEYDLPFASIDYKPDPQARLGMSVPGMYSDWVTTGFPLFALNYFVVSEVLLQAGNVLDLGPLFQNFREWAAMQYGIPATPPAAAPKHQPQ
ncbi:hypothetical protein [Cupriavidus pampae]|uniref:Uncharacterized protein n=1 Tax=Cupriavidus pampae TaxID=659251 RepID=A0ABM8XUU2_9BURK|nr:hypothetical protein [Cupriavidus pampae]CAG9184141.1 hypothetical protein LMG32289_05533 [Cupriavidus pampae]